MSGLSTTGSISLGLALVAGRKRVPRPATGKTAVRITDFGVILIEYLRKIWLGAQCTVCAAFGPRNRHAAREEGGFLARSGACAVRPFEDRRAHAVPGAALRAAPVPAHAEKAAVITLITAAGVAHTRQQRPERAGIRRGLRLQARLPRNVGQPANLLRRQGRRQQPGE